MEGNCPKCGAVERYEPFRLNERIFAAYWKCGTNKTVGGQLERGSECYEAEIAVLTQRAEQAEAAVDANWVTHQQVIAANNRAFAAKAREKRLREGIEALHRTSRSHSAPGIDRQFVTQELAALLAQDGVVNGVESALNTVAALPAAGGELQQQFNVLVKQCEAWMYDAENTQEEASAYGDAMYAIGRFALAAGLKYEGNRLSLPPQEAGDE